MQKLGKGPENIASEKLGNGKKRVLKTAAQKIGKTRQTLKNT
jgi:hypothetical protein